MVNNSLIKYLSISKALILNVGIERETLRVDNNGVISNANHKVSFGNRINNPYITTDFAESQLELITPPYNSSKELYDFLSVLYDICANEYDDEFLFPLSMPCSFDSSAKIAQYDNSETGVKNKNYRKFLLQKYGLFKQLICGIHYNFSFHESLIDKLYLNSNENLSKKEFKNKLYLNIAKKYNYYRWFIVYTMGASPIFDLDDTKELNLKDFENGISYRNSTFGYNNKNKIFLNYNSINEYVDSINKYINDGLISEYKELYSSVRVKSKKNDGDLRSLINDGIEYLEFRNIDINPYCKTGIDRDQIEFVNLFILFLFFSEDVNYNDYQEEALYNSDKIAESGLDNVLLKYKGNLINRKEFSLNILSEMRHINDALSLGKIDVLNKYESIVNDSELTTAYKVKNDIKNKGYIPFAMDIAKKYKKEAFNNRYKLYGYEDMELSTQILIKESIKRGLKVDVLDKKDNFISISKGDNIQYIKQATKTSKDNYATVLAMENKIVTKKILKTHNIKVPNGFEFFSYDEAEKAIDMIIERNVVIKPKSTNFGKGITILNSECNKEQILSALKNAFSYDDTVIVEDFIKGDEYRFLVIGNKVSGILRRVPANVCGNGKNTISELIEIKNKNPLRQNGYTAPLEKIKIDNTVKFYLNKKNLGLDYVPEEGNVIFLRENSNISTGGDSIDYTDLINERFKEIAIRASKAIGANICGVDMIIEDYTNVNSNYGIIELNFNPAIHIHSFPYKGVERNIAKDILELLDLI